MLYCSSYKHGYNSMEKQVYSLRLCRNYFKWLNRLLLLLYSVVKYDLYVIMMNKLNRTIEIKCTLLINCKLCGQPVQA